MCFGTLSFALPSLLPCTAKLLSSYLLSKYRLFSVYLYVFFFVLSLVSPLGDPSAQCPMPDPWLALFNGSQALTFFPSFMATQLPENSLVVFITGCSNGGIGSAL